MTTNASSLFVPSVLKGSEAGELLPGALQVIGRSVWS